jgi:hypothetical protein
MRIWTEIRLAPGRSTKPFTAQWVAVNLCFSFGPIGVDSRATELIRCRPKLALTTNYGVRRLDAAFDVAARRAASAHRAKDNVIRTDRKVCAT